MLELGGNTPKDGPDNTVIEGTDAGFMADVIEASQTTPVIVQFTAPWCGPCRTLGPQLESAVRKTSGKVRLVRINIDENPQVAGQLRVQSIPAVFGFANGQPVDGFMGAQPQSQIEAFVQQISAAAGEGNGQDAQIDAMLDAADNALEEGAGGEAAQVYGQILSVKPDNLRALSGLTRCYLASGDVERAKETLALAPPDKANDAEIVRARSMIELAETAGDSGNSDALASAVEMNPDDHQSRLDYALALIGKGQHEDALDHLLELYRRAPEWNEGAAKEQMFKLFDALGPQNPVALKGRRRLSSLILA